MGRDGENRVIFLKLPLLEDKKVEQTSQMLPHFKDIFGFEPEKKNNGRWQIEKAIVGACLKEFASKLVSAKQEVNKLVSKYSGGPAADLVQARKDLEAVDAANQVLEDATKAWTQAVRAANGNGYTSSDKPEDHLLKN